MLWCRVGLFARLVRALLWLLRLLRERLASDSPAVLEQEY